MLHTQRIRENTDLNIDFRDTSEKMRGRTCSQNDVRDSSAVPEVTSLIHVSVMMRRSRDAEAAVRSVACRPTGRRSWGRGSRRREEYSEKLRTKRKESKEKL